MQITRISSSAETSVTGTVVLINSAKDMPYAENRYRFCGLPMGVSMLPRFAAIVCRTMMRTIDSSRPAIDSIMTEKGTKVISATSFVIAMLAKKQRNTRQKESCLVVFIFLRSACPMRSKVPCF